MGYSPSQLGDFISKLPEDAEVTVIVNHGHYANFMWTTATTEEESKSPENKRWARDALNGMADAIGAKIT